MILDEFLILLGVDADTEEVRQFNAALTDVMTIATAAVATLTAVGAATVAYFDSSIRGAKELAKEKGLLFDISKKELELADDYVKAMDKTDKSLQSIKTKIALGLAPTILNAVGKFNLFLSAHKQLITDGIQMVIKALYNVLQVIFSTVSFIDKIISSTIGWKNALYLLAVALALINRQLLITFATNPVFQIIAAIGVLMLLIDDFMGYLDGKDSELGEYWGKLIEFANSFGISIEEVRNIAQKAFTYLMYGLGLLASKIALAFALAPIKGFLLLLRGLGTFIFGLKAPIMAVGAAIKAAFIANPVGIAIAAIAALAYLVYDFVKFVKGEKSLFADFWKPFIDWMGWSEDDLNAFVDGVTDVFNALVAAVTTMLDGLISFVKGWWDMLAGLFKMAKGFLTGDTGMVKEAWGDIVDGIIQQFDGLMEFLGGLVEAIAALFGGWLDSADIGWDVLLKAAEAVLDALVTVCGNIFKVLGDLFDEFVAEPIAKSFKRALDKVKGWLRDLVASARATVRQFAALFVAVFAHITAPFRRAFAVVQQIFGMATDDSMSFIDKLAAIFGLVVEFITAPFLAAFDWVLSKFGMTRNDISSGVKRFGAIFSSVYSAITSPFVRAFDWILSKWNSTVGQFESGISRLKNMFSGVSFDFGSFNNTARATGAVGGNTYNTTHNGGDVTNRVNVNGANTATTQKILSGYGLGQVGRNIGGVVKA